MIRLPWRRNPDGGFIAYPNGEEWPGQRATLHWAPKATHEPEGSPQWHWTVLWEGRFFFSDKAYSKQQGADRATEAWWLEVALADQRELADAPVRAFADRLLSTGLYDLTDIELQHLPQEQLATLMDELTRVWRGTKDGGSVYRKQVHEVMKVLSMELFRRRQMAETTGKS